MKNTALKLFLSLSIFFSLVLLLTDAELWAAAPDNAYALITLTIIDSIILVFVFKDRGPVPRFTLFWGC